MACTPSLAFTKYGTGPQSLEVYLDLICPFSRKLLHSLASAGLTKSPPKIFTLLIRHQPQPWHASSMLLHEASIAFGQVHPEHWWEFFSALMDRQEEFYDIPTSTMTPEEVRDKIVVIAAEVLDKKGVKGPLSAILGEVRAKLVLNSTPNGGNSVTNDLKYCIKLGRQNGIHVTPTALFNGLIEPSISSSWGDDDWSKFLKEKGL